MTDQADDRWWMAEAVQTGTNDRMCERAATKGELDTLLYGRAYPAKHGSVRYYRIPKPKDETNAKAD